MVLLWCFIDGLVGTGLMPYKAHSLKYQHFMLFRGSLDLNIAFNHWDKHFMFCIILDETTVATTICEQTWQFTVLCKDESSQLTEVELQISQR